MNIKIDKIFLLLTFILIFSGVFIFGSASLGILARNEAKFYSILFSHYVLGFLLGFLLMFIFSNIPYKVYKKIALPFFIFAIIFTSLVFVPGIGFSHGGASRWLLLGGFSFQPGEVLKIAFVIFFASWLSSIKGKVSMFKYSVVPFVILMSIIGALLLKQPDTGTFLVIGITGFVMLYVAGAKYRDLSIFVFLGTILFSLLAFFKPYLRSRIMTFIDPSNDPLGASYQVKQALIAIGSGGFSGRGFGQSVQKFSYLPEPVGDSIFAVFSEEFGFIGCFMLLSFFTFFALRGFRIANRTDDLFGRLLVLGIVILVISQSLINVASMVGVFPLTGMPIIFISQGGSALLLAMLEVGIVLNISKNIK